MLKLIGNTQSNKMECAGNKECMMYGYFGGDEFHLTIDHSNSTIKDFMDHNDEDKLYIEDIRKEDISCFGAGPNSSTSSIQSADNKEILGCTGSGSDTSIKIGKYVYKGDLMPGKTEDVIITLEGESVSTADGWMRIARDDSGYYTDQQKKDNPIYIK